MDDTPYSVTQAYDSIETAEAARTRLIAAGFDAQQIKLDVTVDEAGPSSGSFALEYKEAEQAQDRSFLDNLLTRDDPNEGLGKQPVGWTAPVVLTVVADSPEQLDTARSCVQAG